MDMRGEQPEREAPALACLPEHMLQAIRDAPPLSAENAAIVRGLLGPVPRPAEAPAMQPAA